jgi:DNA-binding beta-propeller fold protein YncE
MLRPSILVALALLVAPAAARAAPATIVGEAPATGSGVFRFPQAVAYTPGGGTIVVGDQYSAVVQRFDRTGTWLGQLGGYADDRENGRIGVVGGVASDRSGDLFVLDSENDRVQVFEAVTGAWLAAWGSSGQGPGQFRLGDNTGAGGIAIDQPTADAVPVAYIADQYNHRVQAFALDQTAGGRRVLPAGTRAGDVVPIPTPTARWGTHLDCSAGSCPPGAYLNYPQGIAVEGRPDAAGRRHVLVADDDNHRVVEFLPDGTFVRQLGSYGTAPGQFRFPYDVGIDAHDPRQLYVADNNNHRVQAFDMATFAFLRTWGQFGTGPDDLAFTRALAAVADDPAGGVAVADTANNRVQTFDPAGARTAEWGIAGRGPGYVTRPEGVAVDASGAVYVADTLDHRVERLAPDGAYLGQTGYISSNSGFAAPAAGDGQFNTPGGIAVDRAAGRVWVADTANNRVQQLSLDGAWLATVTGFSAPRAIAVAPDGAVLVADTGNGRVQRRDPATQAWSTLARGLTAPAGVAATATAVYVADTGVNRVLRLAGGATQALPPPPGGFHSPTGLAAGGGAVYVSDTASSRVLRFDEATSGWEVVGSEGTGMGSFIAPAGLALDPAGASLVVADNGNDRVQRITFSGSPPPAPVGLTVATTGTGTGTVTSSPAGIACPTDCAQHFTPGSTVSLQATPAPGSAFAGWAGACSGPAPTCDVAMAGERAVTAAFAASGPPPPPPQTSGPGPTSGPPPTSSGAAPASPPTRDRTPPTLRGVTLRPDRLRAARAGATIAATAVAATLRYAVSEPGTLTLAVERRRRGGRYVAVRGSAAVRTTAGAHHVSFRARIAGRPLRAGRYRLVLRARDRAGNRSAPRRVAFTVVSAR